MSLIAYLISIAGNLLKINGPISHITLVSSSVCLLRTLTAYKPWKDAINRYIFSILDSLENIINEKTVNGPIFAILMIIGDSMQTLRIGAIAHVVENYSGSGYRCEIMSIDQDRKECDVKVLYSVLDPIPPITIKKVCIDDIRLLPEVLADPTFLNIENLEMLLKKVIIPILLEVEKYLFDVKNCYIHFNNLFLSIFVIKALKSILYNPTFINLIFKIEENSFKYISIFSSLLKMCKYNTDTNGLTDLVDIREAWIILYQRIADDNIDIDLSLLQESKCNDILIFSI